MCKHLISLQITKANPAEETNASGGGPEMCPPVDNSEVKPSDRAVSKRNIWRIKIFRVVRGDCHLRRGNM